MSHWKEVTSTLHPLRESLSKRSRAEECLLAGEGKKQSSLPSKNTESCRASICVFQEAPFSGSLGQALNARTRPRSLTHGRVSGSQLGPLGSVLLLPADTFAPTGKSSS